MGVTTGGSILRGHQKAGFGWEYSTKCTDPDAKSAHRTEKELVWIKQEATKYQRGLNDL